jgi:hypothetical protein
MTDTGEYPHQPGRVVTTSGFALRIDSGQIAHVRASPFALWSSLINRRRMLEVRGVVTEENAILNSGHGVSLLSNGTTSMKVLTG